MFGASAESIPDRLLETGNWKLETGNYSTIHFFRRPGPRTRGLDAGRHRDCQDRGRAATGDRAQVRPALSRAHPSHEASKTDSRRSWMYAGARAPAPGGRWPVFLLEVCAPPPNLLATKAWRPSCSST